MKHIQTFENFINEAILNEKMLDAMGRFDTQQLSVVWDEAVRVYAFGKNSGLTNPDEIWAKWKAEWNDPKSELYKVVKDNTDKQPYDIAKQILAAKGSPASVRAGIEEMRKRLESLKGVLAGAEKAPVFVDYEKEVLAWCDKVEQETPMTPATITIMKGEAKEMKGIKEPDYFEKGSKSCTYEVIVVLTDGRAIKGPNLYESEKTLNSRPIFPTGPDRQKLTEFLVTYDSAIGGIGDKSVYVDGQPGTTVKLVVENTLDLKEADKIIDKKVVPSLEKTFKGAKITF